MYLSIISVNSANNNATKTTSFGTFQVHGMLTSIFGGACGACMCIWYMYVSCLSQTCSWPLPVQTQGTQLLKLFIQIY